MAESNLHRVVSKFNTSRYLNIIIPAYVYDWLKYKRAECMPLLLATSEEGVAVAAAETICGIACLSVGMSHDSAAEQMVINSDKLIIQQCES